MLNPILSTLVHTFMFDSNLINSDHRNHWLLKCEWIALIYSLAVTKCCWHQERNHRLFFGSGKAEKSHPSDLHHLFSSYSFQIAFSLVHSFLSFIGVADYFALLTVSGLFQRLKMEMQSSIEVTNSSSVNSSSIFSIGEDWISKWWVNIESFIYRESSHSLST